MSLRICCLAMLPLVLSAQQPSTTPRTSNLLAVGSPIDLPLIPDSPFTATAVTVIKESTANGTTAKATKTITVIARDSKGRAYVETHDTVWSSQTGNGAILYKSVSDPISRTITDLDVARMQTTKSPLPASGPPSTPTNDEDLGLSTIAGLSVHGHRHSMNEYWFSDQLQMNVMTKTEQTGSQGQTRSVTLTQVRLNEPAAELFYLHDRAEPNLVTKVNPIYPPQARSARVQGTVEFVATIGPDGVVKDLELVRGHPSLVRAAREAVLQWEYEPAIKNGKAVSAKTDVILNFSLSQ